MKELLENLNKALEVFNNSRISDFGEFHRKVDEIITPLLPKKLRVTVWHIKTEGLTGLKNDDAFTLNKDFIDDKRTKGCRAKGRMVKCWYEQNFEGETIDEIIGSQKRASLQIKLAEQREYIAEVEEELSDAKDYLHRLLTKGE